mgnify:FL=1
MDTNGLIDPMQKKTKDTLTYILSIALAVVLLFFSFKSVDWKQFVEALKFCRWGYVLMSMGVGMLVIFIRSLRWRMQILPIDGSIGRITTFNAYGICMVVNIVLSRVGEIVRCGYVTKHSERGEDGQKKASVDKVLGTVVVDRVWDGVSLAIVFVIMLLALWNKFGAFFRDTVFSGLSGRKTILWIVIALVAVLVAVVLLSRRLSARGGVWAKIWGVLQGMGNGLSSCLHMKNGWLFIVYTAVIWICYWLMSAGIMWSLQGIDPSSVSPELADSLGKVNDLGMEDALFLMFAGALSSLVPVPGGFGAFHTVVSLALSSVYGIPFGIGMIFATLSHESQIVADLLVGVPSYIYETVRK